MGYREILMLLTLLCVSMASASESDDILRLDLAVGQRENYVRAKERRIDSLRRELGLAATVEKRLDLCNSLYEEFLVFSFDSVMTYIDRAETLAGHAGGYEAMALVRIHRALAMATSGHFSHAVEILDGVDAGRLSRRAKEEYYAACEWTYGVWAEYSGNTELAPRYTARSLLYLDSLIDVTDPAMPEYTYRLGEKYLRSRDYRNARINYESVLERIPVNCRLYAQAAYALAIVYKEMGDMKKYREWLVNAAISDQVTPLKENLALQQLALYLKTEEGDIEHANNYLKLALDDAVFYNNRLRMMEIARKIPDITNVYQDTVRKQNRRLKYYIGGVAVLFLVCVAAVCYALRSRKKVSDAKDSLARLNESLRDLNMQLGNTNRSREQYVGLFLDLCAAYIDKLNRFPTVLKLKVKQLSDLNAVAARYVRPSEAETREMFLSFDSAFLKIYPDFIKEFNSLLRPDCQIVPRKGELLNTDLRIYALVRMGVTDSNKIATLLFLSPQTIFNHRTQVRNRALDRDTFETGIQDIYPV